MRFFNLLPLFPAVSIIVLLCGSCGKTQMSKSLSDIESYIDSRPDSALAAIRQIDTAALRGRAVKAKYSLLHAIALDKNYIDTADTRIVQPAVDWYDRHGSPEERLKAYMYLGTEQYNAGHYGQAAISLTKAMESVPQNKDKLVTGILYDRIARIHSMTRDYSQASIYIDRSIESFKHLGRSDFELMETHRKAQNLVNLRKWDDAIRCYSFLLKNDRLESSLREMVEADFAMTLLTSPNPDEAAAYDLFSKIIKSKGALDNENHYGAFAYTLSKKGLSVKADSIMNSIAKRCGKDNIYYTYWRHRIEKDKGDFKKAYFSLWASMRSSDSLTTLKYTLSAANAQREYLERKSQLDSIIIKDQKRVLLLTAIVIFLSALLALVLIKWKNSLARNEREKTMLIVESLKNELSRVVREKEEYESRIDDFGRQMTKAKFAYLAKLYELVHRYGDDDKEDIISVYSRIKKHISSLNENASATRRFEEMLNEESNNIMKRFREDFPDLNEETYRLASFVFAGFDNTTLMLLLGKSPANTRSLKNRLKKKIESSESNNKEEFLKYYPRKG